MSDDINTAELIKERMKAQIINNYYYGDVWNEATSPPGPKPTLESVNNVGNRVQIELRGFRAPPEASREMEMFRGSDLERVRRSFRVLESGMSDIEPNGLPQPYIKVGLGDFAVKVYMNAEDVKAIQTLQKKIPPQRVVES